MDIENTLQRNGMRGRMARAVRSELCKGDDKIV